MADKAKFRAAFTCAAFCVRSVPVWAENDQPTGEQAAGEKPAPPTAMATTRDAWAAYRQP